MLNFNHTELTFIAPLTSEKLSGLNLVKSAIYKWFSYYENTRSAERTALVKALLDEEISFLNTLLPISGLDHFQDFIDEIEVYEISNFIEEISMYPCGVGMYTVNADVRTQASNKAGHVQEFALDFVADVQIEKNFDVKFLRVKVKQSALATSNAFQSQYASHRAHAVIHQCMGLIERKLNNEEAINAIFPSVFSVQALYHGTVHTKAEIIDWIAKMHERLNNISLTPVNVVTEICENNRFETSFDLLIEGDNKDGDRVGSLSKNKWTIEDNPNEEYGKVRSIEVEKLDPIFI